MSKTLRGLGAVLLAACLAAVLPAGLSASPVTIPNAFSNGEIADAEDVNANFSALKDAVDDNDTRIGGLEDTVDDHDARIGELEAVAPLQVVEVNAVSGDASAGGTALLDAVEAITDASAARPYLIRLSGGSFDIGSETLALQPYMTIVGDGAGSLVNDKQTLTTSLQGGTLIAGNGAATVSGASDAALRNLSVQNSAGNPAVENDGARFRLTRVAVLSTVTGSPVAATGIENGGSIHLTHVIVWAFGGKSLAGAVAYGLHNGSGSATVHSSTFYASAVSSEEGGGCERNCLGTSSGYAIYNTGTARVVTVHQSTLYGNGSSLYNDTAYTVNLVASFVDGLVVPGESTATSCLLTYEHTSATYTTAQQDTVSVPSFVALSTNCLSGGGGQSKQNVQAPQG